MIQLPKSLVKSALTCMYAHICIGMCIYIYICMYVCMHDAKSEIPGEICFDLYVYIWLCTLLFMVYVNTLVCVYVCIDEYMYVWYAWNKWSEPVVRVNACMSCIMHVMHHACHVSCMSCIMHGKTSLYACTFARMYECTHRTHGNTSRRRTNALGMRVCMYLCMYEQGIKN